MFSLYEGCIFANLWEGRDHWWEMLGRSWEAVNSHGERNIRRKFWQLIARTWQILVLRNPSCVQHLITAQELLEREASRGITQADFLVGWPASARLGIVLRIEKGKSSGLGPQGIAWRVAYIPAWWNGVPLPCAPPHQDFRPVSLAHTAV